MNKQILTVVAAMALSALPWSAINQPVWAEQVQLPYQSPDDSGNQWLVYPNGQLQQQGNQPIFQQAGVVTINGRQPQQMNQQGNLDEKLKEISVTFRAYRNVNHERRVRFMDDGVVRIVDIFENTLDKEQAISLQYMTNTNYGVNGAETISDSKKKGELGWVADTGAGRAAMSVWGGKGSKTLPNVRYNEGNNMVTASFNLTAPSKTKVAIVHWHASVDNIEAGRKWISNNMESRSVRDLPPEIRKAIVNIAGTSSGSIGDRELLRGDTADIIELRGGDQIRGDLKVENYQLNTAYGAIQLPADKIASILNVGEFRPRQLLVTQEGEIFGGELQQPTVAIQLSSGQDTQIPLTQISRLGYRTGGADAPEWKLDKPMLFLRSGERSVIAAPDQPIEFVTRYGKLTLQPAQVAIVNLKTAGGVHEIYLSDGSKLSGIVSNPQWAFKLVSATGNAPVAFPLAALSRVQLSPLPENIGEGKATLAMQAGDIVATRLDGKLKLQTSFDTIDIDATQIRTLAKPDEGLPDVQVTMFDQSTFRGTLQATSMKCKLADGLIIDVPVAAIRDYDNPQPFPSQVIVGKVQESIAKLKHEDWKEREAAEAGLITMGPTIASVLEEAIEGQTPEVKQRLGGIVKRLRKDQPASTSRLSPPEPIQ